MTVGYKSTLTGEIIEDLSHLVKLRMEIDNVLKNLYFADCVELKQWWLHDEPKPDLGGELELSSHFKTPIEDESSKMVITYKSQVFTFANTNEAVAWYQEVFS